MSTYVDKSVYKYKRMLMCHMASDTLTELHAMADKIGVGRKHYQGRGMPHYDICKTKRSLAIEHGAIETDGKGIIKVIKGMGWGSMHKTDII